MAKVGAKKEQLARCADLDLATSNWYWAQLIKKFKKLSVTSSGQWVVGTGTGTGQWVLLCSHRNRSGRGRHLGLDHTRLIFDLQRIV